MSNALEKYRERSKMSKICQSTVIQKARAHVSPSTFILNFGSRRPLPTIHLVSVWNRTTFRRPPTWISPKTLNLRLPCVSMSGVDQATGKGTQN